jgi:hypothetical protein
MLILVTAFIIIANHGSEGGDSDVLGNLYIAKNIDMGYGAYLTFGSLRTVSLNHSHTCLRKQLCDGNTKRG